MDEPVAPVVAPVVAALLRLCCSSAKALLQLCCSSVAPVAPVVAPVAPVADTPVPGTRDTTGQPAGGPVRSEPVSICTFVPVKQVNGVVPGGPRPSVFVLLYQ